MSSVTRRDVARAPRRSPSRVCADFLLNQSHRVRPGSSARLQSRASRVRRSILRLAWVAHATLRVACLYAGLSVAAAEALHRTTHMPRWASAATATIAIGLIPHVRGVIRHKYPFDGPDWAFDLVDRSAPLVVWRESLDQPWTGRAMTAAAYVGGYLSLACYASP